jgi:hypothetical protein
MKSWLVLVVVAAFPGLVLAEQAPAGAHLLFDFEAGAAGWHANVWGKGKMSADRAADARVGRAAMAVHLRDLHGANLIGPPIPPGQAWRQRRWDRVRFWAKAEKPMTNARFTFVTDEAAHNTYSLHFPMQQAGWKQHTYRLTRCWNRGKKKLDASRITGMYIGGSGTLDFAIDHIELLEAAREVYLRPDRHVLVLPTRTPPTIDGRLNDRAWKRATRLADFIQYRTGKRAVDQTEAWVTYDDEALYVGARLHTRVPDKLKAAETARDAAVWQDDCLEVFVDPRHTHTEWYQFVTNSVGSQFDGLMPGGAKGRGTAWNGTWTVKTAIGKDAWFVEMRLPFRDFGLRPKPGDSWGFNVCREAPSTGELSFWTDTGGKFTRVRGLADLVFATAADEGVTVTNVRLEEKSPGAYILRGHTQAPRAREAAYMVWAQSPGDVKTSSKGKLDIPAGEGEIAVPLEFEAKEEGEAKVWFVLSDPKTRAVLAYGAYRFTVSFPSEADLSKLVLVPTPKELQLGAGAFTINSETIIQIGNDRRESFIGEVIERESEEHYGVRALVRRHAPPPVKNLILVGRPETSPPLKRALAERGLLDRLGALKPEGYVLVVEPERVLVAGKDSRGAYYAARAFLQLVANATSEGQAPRARCCTIVDWPDFPFRGYMIYTSGWPQDPLDEALLKEFIYKEVAGYKYNAIVWQMKAGYRYSRWPRLRNRCALSRETVQEVARFARNHFVEMIPNTNILGHANWIVLKYKELQEDGKPHQLCTRHRRAQVANLRRPHHQTARLPQGQRRRDVDVGRHARRQAQRRAAVQLRQGARPYPQGHRHMQLVGGIRQGLVEGAGRKGLPRREGQFPPGAAQRAALRVWQPRQFLVPPAVVHDAPRRRARANDGDGIRGRLLLEREPRKLLAQALHARTRPEHSAPGGAPQGAERQRRVHASGPLEGRESRRRGRACRGRRGVGRRWPGTGSSLVPRRGHSRRQGPFPSRSRRCEGEACGLLERERGRGRSHRLETKGGQSGISPHRHFPDGR